MSQNPNNRNSLLLCFQEIIKMMPQAGDLNAFLSALEGVEDPLELCLKLANKLRLAPESRGDVTIEELASFFGAPIFLQLNNGNWVLYLGIRKLLQGGVQQERYAVFDPLTKVQGKMLFLQKDQLLKSWAGKAVFIRMEMRGCSVDGKQTSLYCLASIVKHYGDDTDVGRLMHEYAISEDEPSIRLLGKIADDLEYKTKEIRVKWDKLPKIGAAFPCMAIKKDGRFVVLCGVREVPESVAYPETEDADKPKLTTESLIKQSDEVVPGADPDPAEAQQEQAPVDDKPKTVQQAAIWDPYAVDGHRPSVVFINKEEWEEKYSNRVVLVKKHYSIVDENQKFGLRWFIPEFFRQRTLLAQVAIAILAISAIGLVVPLFFQIVVDKVLVNEGRVTLMTIGIGVTIMLCINAILEYLEKYFLLYATNRIDIRLAVKTFARLLSLPVDFYERISSGVLIKHMQQTERIRSFLSGSLFYTALELLSLVVFLPFLFIYSPILTGVVLLFTFMMALVIAVLIKPFQHRLEELYMAEGKRQAMLVETIHGIRTVKSLALEPTQQRKWNDTAAFAITRYFRVAQISITAKTLSGLIEKLMFIAIIWIGALAVFDGTLTVGKLIAFQMLSGRVTGPLVHIVGLVGRSGSGQTTLTKLIQGLYPLQTGIIKYDGIDIREIDRASLRSAIGIVLQDNYFFHGTVRENLSLTKKDATMEEIIYAARLAGADEFIQKMSRGYDSLLEENASNLSGGQRQRLAIARALLPNPRFLIFDEATSALDPESETMVRKNLNMIARNRTVFIISHRLSVLCRADRIVVMDHGDLIEQGTHKELLEQGGIYADFWKQQMGFNEDEQ